MEGKPIKNQLVSNHAHFPELNPEKESCSRYLWLLYHELSDNPNTHDVLCARDFELVK